MTIQAGVLTIAASKTAKVAARADEFTADSFDVKKFVTNFEVLAAAEGGITALREMVLCLAMQGALVDQAPTDEDAGVLIAKLYSASEASKHDPKREAQLRESAQNESATLWAVPLTWRFIRLEQASAAGGVFCDGDWVESKDQDPAGEIRLTQLADVGDGVWRDRSNRHMNRATADRLRCTYLERGDILIARMPDPIGRACIFPGDKRMCATVVDVAILRVRPDLFDRRFLMMAINSKPCRDFINTLIAGTTRQRVSRSNLANVAIPVAPLAEQKRIVTKVDQLMALCDELEARQTKKRETGTRLTKSALEALTSAGAPEEFDIAWTRVVENFDVLIDRAEKVRELIGVVLELATRGVLVRQIAHEGTGQAQLEQLVSERNRIKPGSVSPSTLALAASPPPHPLPASWTWASLEVTTHPVRLIRYGMLMPGPDQREGPLYVKVRNMKNGVIDVASLPRTTPELYAKFAAAALAKGDLLMSIRGSYGGIALVPDEIEGANITQDSARIAPLAGIDRNYLLFVLRSPLCQRYFASIAKGAAVQGINIGDIRRTPIPLPPLAEQQRIVVKVKQLISCCGELESRMRWAEDRASKLVEAAVNKFVAGETET